jgi:hypothetical protein
MTRYWTGESYDPLDWGRYRAALRSSLRGRRGQQLLRDLIAGLDALPEPELSAGALADRETGCVCALGAVGLQRGQAFEEMELEDLAHGTDPEALAGRFDISPTLANEIVQTNDEWWHNSNEKRAREARFQYVKQWAMSHLRP